MAYEYITKYTSPNSTAYADVAGVFGYARNNIGQTYHHWADPATNPTFEGVVSWLTRPNGNTSAHYVAEGSPLRRVACIVSPLDASWHTGTALGNATTIGIEMNPQATEADYDVAAELAADIISAYGDGLKYGHNDWTATQCPGRYDISKIDRLSYTKYSAAEWGRGGDIENTAPPTVTPPVVGPTPPVATAEWIRNLKDITDMKLTVIPAQGIRRINLITLQVVDDVIPKGTQIDIAKETTVGGKKFYISSYSANANTAIGLEAEGLGVPSTPAEQEKPEWLSNLVDIEDKEMWTRSETPVLNIVNGMTTDRLPINTRVIISHSTSIVGIDLLVIDTTKTAIEPLYLSDKPVQNPNDDLIKENNDLLKQILALLSSFVNKFFNIFK